MSQAKYNYILQKILFPNRSPLHVIVSQNSVRCRQILCEWTADTWCHSCHPIMLIVLHRRLKYIAAKCTILQKCMWFCYIILSRLLVMKQYFASPKLQRSNDFGIFVVRKCWKSVRLHFLYITREPCIWLQLCQWII